MGEVEQIAASLSEQEADLLAGRCSGWGSWMFMCAADLAGKGLMRKSGGSYYSTDLGNRVAAHLLSQGADHAE